MRLDRLGASHPTRLSFLRTLMRRAAPRTLDGQARRMGRRATPDMATPSIASTTPRRTYCLVAFSTPLEDSRRTDRVIAEAWDTSYVLYDGVPDADEIARLRAECAACRKPAAIARATSCSRAPTRASDCLTPSSTPWRKASSPTPTAPGERRLSHANHCRLRQWQVRHRRSRRDRWASRIVRPFPGRDADGLAHPFLHDRPRRTCRRSDVRQDARRA